MIDLASITTEHTKPVHSPEAAERLLDSLGFEWDLDGDYSGRGSYRHPEHPELRVTVGHSRVLGYYVYFWREA